MFIDTLRLQQSSISDFINDRTIRVAPFQLLYPVFGRIFSSRRCDLAPSSRQTSLSTLQICLKSSFLELPTLINFIVITAFLVRHQTPSCLQVCSLLQSTTASSSPLPLYGNPQLAMSTTNIGSSLVTYAAPSMTGVQLSMDLPLTDQFILTTQAPTDRKDFCRILAEQTWNQRELLQLPHQ